MGSCFGRYPGLSGDEDLEPPKNFVCVVWWTWLGLLQLYWTDYEPSCAQNMGPTMRTYSYMQIYTYCKING